MRNGQTGPMQMMPQQEPPPQEPPTIEGLQKELLRANQYIDLFRQQRDRAVASANDLQAELAMATHQIGELEKERDERGTAFTAPPQGPGRPSVTDATDAE